MGDTNHLLTGMILQGGVQVVRIGPPIYKPFLRPFGRGPTLPQLGDLLTMIINHLLAMENGPGLSRCISGLENGGYSSQLC